MWRILLLTCLFALSLSAQSDPRPQNTVAVISGDLGSCSADFTVTDTKMKPIYRAKVAVELRYGFGGFHRMNLEVFTNVDGKARVEGLPARSKNPLAFTASYEGRKTVVMVSPDEKCNGSYQAILTNNPVKTDADE